MNIVLIIILFVAVVLVALYLIARRQRKRIGGSTSKSEEFTRAAIEKLTGYEFPQAWPKWLRDGPCVLELDGYNEGLAIAFEYQGPYHTKFMPKDDPTYADYYRRIYRDALKRKELAARDIDLIVVDYKIPRFRIVDYLRGRLHDIVSSRKRAGREIPAGLGKFLDKPSYYLREQTFEPYRNRVLEREMNLPKMPTGSN